MQAAVIVRKFTGAAREHAAYAGGGDSFVTSGLKLSPWLYSTGVGVAGTRDNLELGVRYGLQASPSGFLNQTGSLVLKLKI